MRARFALFGAALAAGTAALAAGEAGPKTAPICQDAKVQQVDDAGGAKLKRLDQLPPAKNYLTVLRIEDGCVRPLLASDYRRQARR